MAATILYVAISLLAIDSALEMSLIVATVSWLHSRAGKGFEINYQDEIFLLAGKPLNFLLDQGHTSNGAAGCGLVVICIGGTLALFLRHRQLKHTGTFSGFTKTFYNFWLYMTAISVVFTIAALVYVFTVTYMHTGQHINLAIASTLNNHPYPNNVPYPRDTWTPQNWYPAVLDLDILLPQDRSTIQFHLRIMQAWQWNLIPMVVFGAIVSALAFRDRARMAKSMHRVNGAYHLESARIKAGSPFS